MCCNAGTPLLTVFTLASKARFLPVLLTSGQKSCLTSASFFNEPPQTNWSVPITTSTCPHQQTSRPLTSIAKNLVIMPSIARRVEFLYSNNSCMIFPDATPPICGVADTLGRHTCAALHALPPGFEEGKKRICQCNARREVPTFAKGDCKPQGGHRLRRASPQGGDG